MIEQSVIDNILEASDCYEVIKDFIDLKKSGANWVGLSPFSDEKTPSFTVSPSKNLWKDFSSGQGGSSVKFLTETQKMTFPEAIKYLGQKYGIEIPEKKVTKEQFKVEEARRDLFSVVEFAEKIYFENGLSDQSALDFYSKRGFSKDIVEKFKIGYSFPDWKTFSDIAIKNKHSQYALAEADLISSKDRKYWDKFRGRIMFPIKDHRGRTVGFGARVLVDDKSKKEPKYFNSSETKIYHKSKLLYGLNLALPHIVRNDNCYLVEGYTDVLSFHQEEVCNTVASCGTALTPEQITLIMKYTKNVTFIFDGDKAGIKASFRSIDIALELGANVNVVRLIDIDPDDLAKAQKSNLRSYLNDNIVDFVDYKCSFINNAKVDSKAKRITNIISSIAKIKSTIKKNLYSEKVSKMFKISKEDLKNNIKDEKRASKRVYKKEMLDDRTDVETLIDLIQNNSELIVEGVTLSANIALRIFELEEPDLHSKDLYGLVISDTPTDEKSFIEANEALDTVEDIFKRIKKKTLLNKLKGVSTKDLHAVQHLIALKNNL